MTGYQDTHNAGCGLCQRQLTEPQPFHEDLCRFNIAPNPSDSVIQCPHLAVPGSELCGHHLEHAITGYIQLTAHTAPFN